MAIIFQDFFEEEVETLLEHHTPDIGDGWSILFDSFTTAVVLVKPLGGAGEPYVVSPDTSNNGMGRAFALQPAPTSADVAVEIDVFETDWSRANSYNRGLFARDTGGHTHYAVSILPNGNSQPSIRLFKTVAGSSDVIGSHDATLQNGDVIRFECYDASKRVLLNGVEVISVADNDIAGPGGAGLYWGNWNGQNGGGHPDRRSDIGFITVEAAQVGPVHVDLSAAPAGTATASAAGPAARAPAAPGGGAVSGVDGVGAVGGQVAGVWRGVRRRASKWRGGDFPPLRGGAGGRWAVLRLGDVFGPPVNLASRLTAVARRNRVIIDAATAELLPADDFETRPLPARPVRGFGLVEPVSVRRR